MASYQWTHVDQLVPWDRNPRKNDYAAGKVADSIRRFGFPAPIVTWNGQVVAGHTRLKAMQLVLGENPDFLVRGAPAPGLVPVVEHPFASQREADAYAIADNRLSQDAQWNFDLLRGILDELGGDAASTGFSDEEVRIMLDATDWKPPRPSTTSDEDSSNSSDALHNLAHDGETLFLPQDLVDCVHRKTENMPSTSTLLQRLRQLVQGDE